MLPPRVLITRAAHQGSALAERLRALGADPLLVPALETVAPTSFAALDAALTRLGTFHWLLFTSANAVEALAARLRHRPSPAAVEPADLLASLASRPRVAAIGPATARALEQLGIPVDLIPPQAVAESLTEALLPQAHQPDGTPTRFLLLRAQEAREHLPETLVAAGGEVTTAPVYRTVVPAGSVDLLHTLLADPARSPQAITFTSSSTVRNLLALCEAAGVALPETALRVSIGPITSQTLGEHGLPPHAEAQEPTVDSLAAAVMTLFATRKSPGP